jgi:uncharacterized membrane protein
MDQAQKRLQAERQVAKLKGFYGHLSVYAIVMSILGVINSLTPGPWWFQWPLLGWGIGVALHALGVFVLDRAFGPAWEEKKIDELMKH